MKQLIVEDSAAMYGRLLNLLGGFEKLTAFSIACSLRDAVAKIRMFPDDAAVLNVRLPGGNGLEALAKKFLSADDSFKSGAWQ